MKTIRVSVREVCNVMYEVEVEDDFTDLTDHIQVGDYLWANGIGPDPISTEVESEEIQDVWEA